MMNITIKVEGLEPLVDAINRLVGGNAPINVSVAPVDASAMQNFQPVPQQPMPQVPTFQQPAAQQPMQTSVPTQPMQQQQMAMPQQTIPTTAMPQGYTQDQIAVAMTGLMDQGKQPVVMQILNTFGANSLLEVPVERYPELAVQMRGAGANI